MSPVFHSGVQHPTSKKPVHPASKLRQLLVALSLLVGLCAALPAMALSLDDAKAQGLVGEQPDGYLGSVSNRPAAAVQQLLNSINEKRRSAYQERAANAGVSLQVMEQRVGQRLIERTSPGEYVLTPNGWQKK